MDPQPIRTSWYRRQIWPLLFLLSAPPSVLTLQRAFLNLSRGRPSKKSSHSVTKAGRGRVLQAKR
jgi:hypothetical protein